MTKKDEAAPEVAEKEPVADELPADADGGGGTDEVQAKVDEAEEKGYIGHVPDPFPNSAYSLQSGPDSPGAADLKKEAVPDGDA